LAPICEGLSIKALSGMMRLVMVLSFRSILVLPLPH
jgi:hypothetical protein